MSGSSKQPSSSFEGEFGPGQVLIGRYRIVALVGEGGMGQVYLADDLVLGQPVAVKFLPAHVAASEGGLERFREEVRHAREVTHPNVARVHDIGEVDGRHFLTMEFVDGEDLASLVRRIGRLPAEKAGELAQQICAGLAEAHRKGVLHRDLKPANVMLDGEGRARLTDFGLAIAEGADAPLAGTPQYMAPEQLQGVAATVRSEVYSLGLVLYELYTGQRALRGRTLDELRREHESGAPDTPSTHLADIDPVVEAVIAACLARNPEERPASVAEVARALPGGDPLAAAMAAGETPSPDVVAAARAKGALPVRIAFALLLGVLALLVALPIAKAKELERRGIDMGLDPAILDAHAREVVTELMGVEVPRHSISWHRVDKPTTRVLEAREAEKSASLDLQPIVRHARFAPEPILARGALSEDSPAPTPGSVHVVIDASGRLVYLRRDPPRDEASTAPPGWETARVPEETWNALLERASFPPSTLVAVEPGVLAPVFVHERRAWERTDPDGGPRLRVEAAGLGGKPVSFEVFFGDDRLGASRTSWAPGWGYYVGYLIIAIIGYVAWRNVRSRRSDVAGAFRLGVFEFVAHIAVAFGGPLPLELEALGQVFQHRIQYAAYVALGAFSAYLALEPFARRHWPQTLIAWTRLLEGRVRDPAVGREVLLGTISGLGVYGSWLLIELGLGLVGLPSRHGGPLEVASEGPFQAVCAVIHTAGDAATFAGLGVLFVVLLRWLLRRPRLAYGAFLVLMTALGLTGGVGVAAVQLLAVAFFLLLLTRVGFLSVVSMMAVTNVMETSSLTLRAEDWHFGASLAVVGTLAALAVAAYRVAVAGRSPFGSDTST